MVFIQNFGGVATFFPLVSTVAGENSSAILGLILCMYLTCLLWKPLESFLYP